MEEINYKKLGFKSGLEIHQQLDTHKLFCNCPSLLRQDSPDFGVSRRFHAVAGESGEIDIAAKHEAEQDKSFLYQGYETTCLVELDEEPPHEINKEALKIALQISILLNATILPITQIMRKTVIDGSNTSGFQRTVMIAYGGYVETSFGKVRINSIFLEEDSARPIERKKDETVYRLDRLGIPLVEIMTEPDIKSAEQGKETALKIGRILRGCKVKRGIGTIRQDINISIRGSNRVELKGFQDPSVMIKTIENEVLRQKEFVDKGKRNPSEVRNCLSNGTSEFLRPMPGSARMYPETDLPLLKISHDFINNLKRNLPKLRDELEEELRKKGLSEEMIKMLFKKNKLEEFKELFEIINNPNLIGKVLLVFPKDIAKREKKSVKEIEKILTKEVLIFILENLKEKKIIETDIKNILEKIIKGVSLEEAISVKKEDFDIIEEKVIKIIKEKPGLSSNAYMGLLMKEFRGKISGEDLVRIIKKHLV